jgi:hypothetical protein
VLWPCSRTIRTARSRTSEEYRLGRAMGSILSTNEPSDNPGTIQVGGFWPRARNLLQHSELQRLGEMLPAHLVVASQIGDRAGDLAHAVHAACAEPEFRARLREP